MNWQNTNVAISIAVCAMACALTVYAWHRRQVRGALWFVGLVGAVGWVTLWYAFEAAAGTDLRAYLTFSKIEYVGLCFIPVVWLGFALTFSGRERVLSRSRVLLLSLIPAVTILLAFTNDWHGLIWKVPSFDLRSQSPIFKAEYGLGFWVYTLYAYIVFFYGSVILLRRAFDTWKLYQMQAALIFVGTALPWISNLGEIFDVTPLPGLYMNTLFLGLSLLCFAFALFRLRLLDIMPLAYDTILNNVPDGLIVVDMQNRILALNRFVQDSLGSDGHSPIGLPLEQFAAQYEAEWDAVRETFEGTHIFHLQSRTVELRISPVRDRRGRQRGRLFIFSDVTDRVRIEQEQASARRFAELVRDIGNQMNSTLDVRCILALIADNVGQVLRHSRVNIMLIDEDGCTTRVHEHRGYPPETAPVRASAAFDYRQYATFTRAAQAGRTVIVPDTRRDPDWQDVAGVEDIRSFASAPIMIDGSAVGFINLDGMTPEMFDADTASRLHILAQQAAIAIKNARLYEQVQRQTEELQRRVESLTITQQVYKDIGFSLHAQHLLELSLDAAMRLSQADSGFVALLEAKKLHVVQHYGRYRVKTLDSLLRRKAGIIGEAVESQRPLLVKAPAPLVSSLEDVRAQMALPFYGRGEGDDADSLQGLIVLETTDADNFTDDRFQLLGLIADRVAAALENARLVDALGERAATLERLYSQVSNLEQIKSDMIRIAAHDLKNPLSVILNYLGLVINDKDEFESNLDEIHKTMRASAERMHQIIQDFLSLDRIEQIAQNQTMMPIDLRDIVTKAVSEFAPQAAKKRQHFTSLIPQTACTVSGDIIQLYEAVTNFISNAIKYTPEGGTIRIELQANASHASLNVIDSGYGIPKEKQERLFQPFYRVRTREVRTVEGTGLGLHLTKNIIERHHGRLLFTSEYGSGSTFGFELPLYRPDAVQASG